MLEQYGLEWLTPLHVPACCRIDRYRGDPCDPLTRDELFALLDQRDEKGLQNVLGIVQPHGEGVAGFIVYDLWPQCFRVINVGVAPRLRRSGVGRYLITVLRKKLMRGKREGIQLVVHERNLGAQLWLRSLEFRAVDVIRRQFGEDAGLLFAWRLPDPETGSHVRREDQEWVAQTLGGGA